VRTGREYLEALRDGRTVYVDGEAVDDVTTHPAFRGVSSSIAQMYDTAADPASGMQAPHPETGEPVNRVFLIPRSREDLELRRKAITTWADHTHGFVGRGPDHVGAFMAGFASAPEVFAGERGADRNVLRWHERILRESTYLSYVIIPPQVDRSGTASSWSSDLLQVGVLEERDDGIVIRGSQMLGTSTAVSDHLFVSCIKPLAPEDERYAISLVVPVSAAGLKVYCRRPYAVGQPSDFDYPLSTRFDETDALVVFDDVFVPWEDVFAHRDVDLVRRQWFATPAHVLGNSQAQIRLVTKVKFLAGIARKIAAMNSIDRIPSVQEKLGELASIAAVIEGMVIAAEAASDVDDRGVAVPNRRFLYGAMGLQVELYPRVTQIVRELAGGGLIQLPSSYRDLLDEETKGDVERYFGSSGASATERIQFFKLAWDAIGSEFGGRHQQYEMFYAGAPFVTRGYAFRNYGYEEAVAGVDEFLGSYGLPSAGAAPSPAAGAVR
jgi:4-hydroxyphenylacetate 3-monooxygenase